MDQSSPPPRRSGRQQALAAAFKAGARWSAVLVEPWDKLDDAAQEYARDPLRYRIRGRS